MNGVGLSSYLEFQDADIANLLHRPPGAPQKIDYFPFHSIDLA